MGGEEHSDWDGLLAGGALPLNGGGTNAGFCLYSSPLRLGGSLTEGKKPFPNLKSTDPLPPPFLTLHVFLTHSAPKPYLAITLS